MAHNLKQVCQKRLTLPHSTLENGIIPPKTLKWRLYPNRVLIHPTSSHPSKNWSATKFLKLADILERRGFECKFCVSPQERKQWEGLVSKERLPFFPTLNELARFVYTSGYIIGNDSGIGHLGSLLKIPTLSIFARKSYSHLWRPGWGNNKVVATPNILPVARLKHRYWKQFLTVNQVLRAFTDLLKSSPS